MIEVVNQADECLSLLSLPVCQDGCFTTHSPGLTGEICLYSTRAIAVSCMGSGYSSHSVVAFSIFFYFKGTYMRYLLARLYIKVTLLTK